MEISKNKYYEVYRKRCWGSRFNDHTLYSETVDPEDDVVMRSTDLEAILDRLKRAGYSSNDYGFRIVETEANLPLK